MMKKMKLADVPFGKNFEIWGHAYTVLDGDDKGVKKAVYAAEYYNHVVSPEDERGSDPRMIHLYSPALLLTEDEFARKFSDPKTRVYSVHR